MRASFHAHLSHTASRDGKTALFECFQDSNTYFSGCVRRTRTLEFDVEDAPIRCQWHPLRTFNPWRIGNSCRV